MKVKKALPLVLALLMAGGVFATGCKPNDKPKDETKHEHSYTGWQINEDGTHSPKCVSSTGTCDAPVKTAEKEEHSYGEDNKCKCGATKPADTPAPKHEHSYTGWKDNEDGTHSPKCVSTTGTCDAPVKTAEKEEHSYGEDNKCKCGATKPSSSGEHTHTYTQHKATCDNCDEPNPKATTFKGWDGTDNGFTDDGVSKIYVVGDSTVCNYEAEKPLGQGKLDDRFLPRYGYGTQLHEYLNFGENEIVNLAMSGRSAVSLMGEEAYKTLVNSIGENDYLIIGFGHNDEKLEPNRFGDPNGKIDEAVTDKGDSWKYILNENYIKLAKHRGATPILCTPIVRYNAKNTYEGNTIHDTDHGNYPATLKALGEETETTVVDLTTLTKNLWMTANADAKYFHAHDTYTGTIKPVNTYDGTEEIDGIDGTHVNKFGAKAIAYELANALKSTNLSTIVKNDIVKPTKANDYLGAIQQSFVRTAYSSFDPSANADRQVNGDWYKAAMGTSIGEAPNTGFTMGFENDGYSIDCTNKGKIQSSSDGFGAIFMQLSKNDNFEITAHVKVTGFGNTVSIKQGGFGLMLRDDIYLDEAIASLKSNYVTAGILTVENKSDMAAFSRTGGTLSNGNALPAEVANGSEYDLSMKKVGTTVTVTVGTVTKTFENVNVGTEDSDYMYLCMFTCRQISVKFTNVNFTKN